jgi:histone H3/H4
MGMDEDRFGKLTDRQRHYLRLALTRANSGEIARAEAARGVTVSKAAIDKVFKQAIERLGVTSRFDAARLLAEHEQRMGVRRADLPTTDLSVVASAVPHPILSQEQPEGTNDGFMIALEDIGAHYTPSFSNVHRPTGETRSSSLGTVWGRVWRSLLITLGLALATIALGNVYVEISR